MHFVAQLSAENPTSSRHQERSREIINSLLNHGADPFQQDHEGRIPAELTPRGSYLRARTLDLAARQGQVNVLQILQE